MKSTSNWKRAVALALSLIILSPQFDVTQNGGVINAILASAEDSYTYDYTYTDRNGKTHTGTYTYTLSGYNATITNYTDTCSSHNSGVTDIVIPATVSDGSNTYTINNISATAFSEYAGTLEMVYYLYNSNDNIFKTLRSNLSNTAFVEYIINDTNTNTVTVKRIKKSYSSNVSLISLRSVKLPETIDGKTITALYNNS